MRNLAPTVNVPRVSRETFMTYWHDNYGDGQHVTFLGPTQRGKTTLSHQLLAQVISPQRKCLILAGKPPKRDHVMTSAAKNLNLRVIEEWPPSFSLKDRKNNGWVLRPHQTLSDLNADENNLKKHFSNGMKANYATHEKRITVVDEGGLVYADLGLKKELEAPLTRGAPDNAVWINLQRGRFMTYHAYAAPDHIFIAYDPDESNQKRLSEIGGVDPRVIMEILPTLELRKVETGGTISEFLYIRRAGPQMAIIGF